MNASRRVAPPGRRIRPKSLTLLPIVKCHLFCYNDLMSDDTNPPSNTPPDQRKLMEEKRAQWDAITHKREEQIAAEKAKTGERAAGDAARLQRDQKAYQEEVQAEQARAEGREEWRQELHAKHAEEEKWRKEKEAAALLLAEEQKKRDAAQAERMEYMKNLHKVAVAHHIRDKRLAIEDEAAREVKSAGDVAERAEHQTDEDTARALNHLDAEKQRKIAQIHVEEGRRKKEIEEKARFAAMDCHAAWKEADSAARHLKNYLEAGKAISAAHLEESQTKMRIESERRRGLSALDEETRTKLLNIDQETKHLKDEVLKNASTKKLLIEKQEDRKKQEAERRKDNFEKWLKDV